MGGLSSAFRIEFVRERIQIVRPRTREVWIASSLVYDLAFEAPTITEAVAQLREAIRVAERNFRE